MARRKQAAALLVIAVVHVYLIHWVREAFDVRGAACAAQLNWLIGWWDAAGWMMLWNLPLNLCPVMLQRRIRVRIQRIRRDL